MLTMHFFMLHEEFRLYHPCPGYHNRNLAERMKRQFRSKNAPILTTIKKAGGYSSGLRLQTYYPYI